MSLLEVMQGAESFFDAFNILGIGIALIWIIGSFFVAREITEKKDEFLLVLIALIGGGGMLIFSNDPAQYIFLIVVVVIVLFGMFKILWGNNK